MSANTVNVQSSPHIERVNSGTMEDVGGKTRNEIDLKVPWMTDKF